MSERDDLREQRRHHPHRPGLCRRGSMQKLADELGICTRQEYSRSMHKTRAVKARNRFWAALGYPNLKRAQAARLEAQRRRKLLGLHAWDHSLDHMLEYAAPLIPPSGFAGASNKSDD